MTDRNARRRARRALDLKIGRYTVLGVVTGYRDCALWASTDTDPRDCPGDDAGEWPDPVSLDQVNAIIDRDGCSAMTLDCVAFLRQLDDPDVTATAWPIGHSAPSATLGELAREYGWFDHQLGHDFWLTRNGHGAGFWDRGAGPLGEALSNVAHWEGSCDLYLYRRGKRGKLRIGVQ